MRASITRQNIGSSPGFLAIGYIVVRMLEAYGLWNERAWGEWLGALSGGLYIPFEIGHLVHRPSTSTWQCSRAIFLWSAFLYISCRIDQSMASLAYDRLPIV
jgi:uncharacterized membrane protein (DUF2068 family)